MNLNLRYKYYYIKCKKPFLDIDNNKYCYYIKVIRNNFISDPKKYFYNVFYLDHNKEIFYIYTGTDRHTKLTKNLENRKYLNRYFKLIENKEGVLID